MCFVLTGGSEITGYQIYHVISGKPGVAAGARYCNEVGKVSCSVDMLAIPLPDTLDFGKASCHY